MQAIAREIDACGGQLILQGSQADRQTTPFSDIDLIVFGDLASTELQRHCFQLDQIILRADPLQHHGVFRYSHEMLKRYSESVLPLATLDCATTFERPLNTSIQILNDRYSPAATLRSFVYGLRSVLDDALKIRGMWDWKFKVSQFLLLPTLLAAVLGDYIYKGASFEYAREMYSTNAWLTIVELTRVRAEWPALEIESPAFVEYLSRGERVLGQLQDDPWAVPAAIASWRDSKFVVNGKKFLSETLDLAGLA